MEQIRQKVQILGTEKNVIFTGACQNVNKLYSVMDVFCLPSFYEGMPVVAWEAQANGLPCVFSPNISLESLLSANSVRLPLKKPQTWTTVLESARRQDVFPGAIPDIVQAAQQLQQAYCIEMGRPYPACEKWKVCEENH